MDLTFVDVLVGARNYVQYAEVKEGEQALVVGDTATDPMVIEALAAACAEKGAKVAVIVETGTVGHSSDNWFDVFLKDWPEMIKGAARAADVVFNLHTAAKGRFGIGRDLEAHKTRSVRISCRNRHLMASEWAKFPLELRDIIAKKAVKQAVGKKIWHHTDPAGTDLTMEVSVEMAGSAIHGLGKSISKSPDKINIGVEPGSAKGCNGILISYYTHFGPVPEIRVTVKNGQAVKIEGGGIFGKRLLASFEKYKDVEVGGLGPGVNWIDELMYACHPKGQGTRMAGAIHHSIGGGPESTGKIQKAPQGAHHALAFLTPTLVADGEVIIDKGHMTIFDDPEIRAVASKYGDPDMLLTRSYFCRVEHPLLPMFRREF